MNSFGLGGHCPKSVESPPGGVAGKCYTACCSNPSCFVTLQSTYCATMVQHCEALNRSVQVVNLDPAAEHFSYSVMAGES